MTDEGVLERWMRHEMMRLQDAIVRTPRPLLDLLAEERPAATARDGRLHDFERASIVFLRDHLRLSTQTELRLPISVFLDHESPGDGVIADAAAIRALRELGVAKAEPRDGRLWVGLPLLKDFALRRPTLLQFIHR